MVATHDCFFLFLLPVIVSALPFSFNRSQFLPKPNNLPNGTLFLIPQNYMFRIGSVRLWDSSTQKLGDFTTHLSFTIENNNGSTLGIIFFLAPIGYSIPLNSVGGHSGLFNSSMNQSQIVLVEFVTFANDEWDPPRQRHYVGIYINGSLISLDCASWDPDSTTGQTVNAWINYNATTKNLSVFCTSEKGRVHYMGNCTLSYNIDLMKVFPEHAIIGFSATTGDPEQKYSINSWQFSSSLDSREVNSTSNSGGGRSCKRIPIIIGASAAGFSFFIIVIAVISFLAVTRIRTKSESSKRSHGNNHNVMVMDHGLVNDDLERGSLPKRFSYRKLEKATNSFADNMILGQGGSGYVYKGMLNVNDVGLQYHTVAVKRIFTETANSEKIFINEVKIISRLIHRNLVPFIGWCYEQEKFLLVYEHMPNGSLDTHLFSDKGNNLPWQVRYRIALGLASAIHYLHEEAEQCVIHRDIKPTNVLLDMDFTAKLGDFGVAKLVDPRLRTEMTGVVGTFGYLAPEYANEGKASKGSDIYSFGIVALEIACGRRTYQYGEFYMPLVKWVWQLYLRGNIMDAADERLGSEFNREEMECLLMVGLWCTQPRNKERPKAGQVIKVLQLEMALLQLPNDAHDLTFPAAAPRSSQLLLNHSLLPTMSSSINLGR